MRISSHQPIISVLELFHSNFAHIAQSNTVGLSIVVPDTMKLIQVISLVILAATSASARGTEVLKAFSPRSSIACPGEPGCVPQQPSSCPQGLSPYLIKFLQKQRCSVDSLLIRVSIPFFKDARLNFGALSLYNVNSAGHWVSSVASNSESETNKVQEFVG
ncbi:hypothetical protein P692DRAFT_201807788 [Suillus brevipes Sb2]|nr:hypothetical protein P692DRAFT_201807788 [Suillus brevipes Sb2]